MDTWLHNELESYLISLKGIIDANVNKDKSTVYVKYDCSIINYNWIKLEILVFLKCNCPSILEFDKHSRNNNSKHEFVVGVKDYCCEYCLKSNIEYLLSIKGIEKVYSSYSDGEEVLRYSTAKIKEYLKFFKEKKYGKKIKGSFFTNRVDFIDRIKTVSPSNSNLPPEWATGCFYGEETQILLNEEQIYDMFCTLAHETFHLLFSKFVYQKNKFDRIVLAR